MSVQLLTDGENPLLQEIKVHFNDDPDEEINALYHEANILGLIHWLNKGELPENFREELGKHIAYLADMFSSNLPEIAGQSPDAILRLAARDIQVSRILKERGLARLYRMCRTYLDVEVPVDDLGNTQTQQVRVYQTLRNPDTGESFTHQEPFLGWFTKASHISRSLVFLRFADMDRLTNGLGLDLETAFDQLLKKPTVVGNVLRDVVTVWEGDQPVMIEPAVARRLANKVYADDPDQIEAVEDLASQYEDDPDYHTMQNLIEAVKPGLRKLVEEVSLHPSYHDAKKMVDTAILLLPEVSYAWDPDLDALVIDVITSSVGEDGEKYEAGRARHLLMSDSVDRLPTEIIKDLLRRLPIKNRDALDI